MSTPIIESIAENIKDSINLITTDNEFNQTLVAVRPRRRDFQDASWDDLTVLVSQGPSAELNSAAFTKEWAQQFLLMAIVIDSDDAANPIDTRLNQVRGDIEKKLAEDLTRGGYAIDTEINESTPFIDDETAMSGVAILVTVHYRTKDDDPYTKG